MARHAVKVGELVVVATGTAVTTGATTANVAIPNAADGARARYVLLSVLSGAAYVKPGGSGVTATTGDLPIVAGAPLTLNVQGMTNIAYLQFSASVQLVITPLEVG